MLVGQHATLIEQLDRIWIVLLLLVFMELLFMAAMVAAAAWSVKTVVGSVGTGQAELEGKFRLLIDILLEDARRRNQEQREDDGS